MTIQNISLHNFMLHHSTINIAKIVLAELIINWIPESSIAGFILLFNDIGYR